MAELIDRKAFIKEFAEEHRDYFKPVEARAVDCIFDALLNAPTTTEADIRAKAITDFLKALEEYEQKNWVDHQEYGITWADLKLVAEQLKGEQ